MIALVPAPATRFTRRVVLVCLLQVALLAAIIAYVQANGALGEAGVGDELAAIVAAAPIIYACVRFPIAEVVAVAQILFGVSLAVWLGSLVVG